MSETTELPIPILALIGRARSEPLGPLADELGRFVLVGERDDDDPEGWSFHTTSMESPIVGDAIGVGFDFERGVVHPIKKQAATFADTVLLGRSRSNDIRIDHPSVSKLHARIRLSSSGFELEDAASRNGTFHDEAPVKGTSVEVFPGDAVRFGVCRFIVHATPRLLELLARVEQD